VIGFTFYVILSCFVFVGRVQQLEFNGPIPIPVMCNVLNLVEKGLDQDLIRYLIETYGNVVDLMLLDGNKAVLLYDPTA